MSEGQNIRDVVIRLAAEIHDDTPKAFDSMVKSAVEAQKKVTDAHKKGARAQAQEQQRTAKEIARENTLAARQTARNYERAWKAEQQQLKEKVAAEKKARQELIRANTQAARNQARIYERQWKAEQKQLKEKVAAEKKAAREIAQAQRDARSQYTQASAKLEAMNERTAEGFKQSLSGAMSLGRGVAMLGLVGEKDIEKLLRGLVKVQAAFDVMRGSIELIQGASRAWQAYTTAVESAAAAQTALNAAQSIGVQGAAKGAAKGVAGKAAGSAVAGAAGGVAAGAVGGAGGAAVGGTAMLATASIGAIVAAVAAAMYGMRFATGAANMPKGAGDEAARVPGFWGGVARYKAASMRFTGMGLNDTEDAPNSMWSTSWDTIAAPYAGMIRSENRLGRALSRRDELERTRRKREADAGLDIQRRRALDDAAQYGRTDLASMQTDPRKRYATAKLAVQEAQDKLRTARDEANRLTAQRQAAHAGVKGTVAPTDAAMQEADRRHIEAAEKAVAARREEYATAKALASTIRQSAREQLASIEDRRRALIEEARLIRERTQSDKERFGSLDAGSQARLIAIKRKADAGERLTREEENELAAFSGVKGIGDIVSRGRSRRADAAGWGGFAGTQEEARAARLDRQATEQAAAGRKVAEAAQAEVNRIIPRIRAELVIKDNVVVDLKTDDTAFLDSVMDQTEKLLDERQRAMERAIEARFEDERARHNARDQADLAQRGAG